MRINVCININIMISIISCIKINMIIRIRIDINISIIINNNNCINIRIGININNISSFRINISVPQTAHAHSTRFAQHARLARHARSARLVRPSRAESCGAPHPGRTCASGVTRQRFGYSPVRAGSSGRARAAIPCERAGTRADPPKKQKFRNPQKT